MSGTRIWTIGCVLLMVLTVGLGWLLGIEPRLAEARTADTERASVVSMNQTHEATLLHLRDLSEDLPALQEELDALRVALPADPAIAELLGQLNALAQQHGVEITAFTANGAMPFAAAEAAEAPPAFDPAASDAAAPDATTPAEPTEPAASELPALPPAPEGLIAVPVTVQVRGGAAGVEDFIQSVQTGERLFLVTDLSITLEAGQSDTSLDGLIYALPTAP